MEKKNHCLKGGHVVWLTKFVLVFVQVAMAWTVALCYLVMVSRAETFQTSLCLWGLAIAVSRYSTTSCERLLKQARCENGWAKKIILIATLFAVVAAVVAGFAALINIYNVFVLSL
ncbi:MAG: hypothetical protein ABIH21_00685 [Patescibacteria group bacterium]